MELIKCQTKIYSPVPVCIPINFYLCVVKQDKISTWNWSNIKRKFTHPSRFVFLSIFTFVSWNKI